MAKHMHDEVAYYYDSHPTKEDLMGETSLHSTLVHYLVEVLQQLFRGQQCAIYENLNFYQTGNPEEYPVAPDIAVIKGADYQILKSWRVGKTGPTPQVVFEIASQEAWNKDLEEKTGKYAQMGVKEYFAYDPHERPLRRTKIGARRLFGWQLSTDRRIMQELPSGPDGRLWSFHLGSWLVPEGAYLRLYDNQGNLQLTGMEAEAERAKALAEKLRSLGIDPDQI